MGQSQSKDRRVSDSSTTPLNPPTDRLLEDNYAAFYGSDAFNGISSVALCDPLPPTKLEPTVRVVGQSEAIQKITEPGPRPNILRVSELIDPHDLIGRYQQDLSGNRLSQMGKSPVRKATASALPDTNKRLPGLVESPSGNILGATEFLAHPNRPLAIRERQENIRQVLERAQREAREKTEESEKWPRSSRTSRDKRRSKERNASGSSLGHESFGTSSGVSSSLGNFESRKIEEGRRVYEEKLRKKEESGAGCFNCFRGG